MPKSIENKSKKKPGLVAQLIASGVIVGGLAWFMYESPETEPEGCLEVNAVHKEHIPLGFRDEFQGKYTLSDFKAIPAGAGVDIYFVSAEVSDAASGDPVGVGTWLQQHIDGQNTFYYAMPDLATSLTVFPDGNVVRSGVTIRDVAYSTSIRCVEWAANAEKLSE